MKDHYSFIEAYHKGRLSVEQKTDFEKAMDEDPDLKEAVDNYWKIEPVLDLLVEDDIRDKMKEIKTAKGKNRTLQRWGQIAAAILILVVALSWFLNAPPQKSGQELFVEFYKAPPEPTSRGENDAAPMTPEQITMNRAHTLLQAGQIAEAEEILQNLVTLNSRQKEEAEWLLVLSALEAENKDLARTRLKDILDAPGHSYRNEDRTKELAEALDLGSN